MLDSPYVRRCHVVATRLGIPFDHRPLSVFRDYSEFHAINPLVRAPTLVLDDGRQLMDSGLIIQQGLRAGSRSRLPTLARSSRTRLPVM